MLTSRRLTNPHNSTHLYCLNQRLANDVVYGAKFKSEEFFSLHFLKTNKWQRPCVVPKPKIFTTLLFAENVCLLQPKSLVGALYSAAHGILK